MPTPDHEEQFDRFLAEIGQRAGRPGRRHARPVDRTGARRADPVRRARLVARRSRRAASNAARQPQDGGCPSQGKMPRYVELAICRRLITKSNSTGSSPRSDSKQGALVADMLARLTEPERAALILCDGHGWSHAEAAELLRMPLGSLKTVVARAKAKCRDMWSSQYADA